MSRITKKLLNKTKKGKRFWGAFTVISLMLLIFILPQSPFWQLIRNVPGSSVDITESSHDKYIYENINPEFSTYFGLKEESSSQFVSYFTKPADNIYLESPEQKKHLNVFQKIKEAYLGTEKKEISFSLKKVKIDLQDNKSQFVQQLIKTISEKQSKDLSEDEKNSIKTNLESLMGEEEASTETIFNTNEENVSFITNPNVIEGVNLRYSVIEEKGVKEEIILNQVDSMSDACIEKILNKQDNIREFCSLPHNAFLFKYSLDEGVSLKRSSIEKNGQFLWYFEDEYGRYLSHFEPLFAKDAANAITTKVNLEVEQIDERSGYIKVIADYTWLTDSERIFPITIDPTIIHDSQSEFNSGTLNRTETTSDPKVQIKPVELEADSNTVLLWHMDGDWTDASSNGNDGTAYNGATFAENMKLGSHVGSFDGTNDYVSTSLSLTPTEFTVEWWLYPLSHTSTNFNQHISASWGNFAFHTNDFGGVYCGITGNPSDRFEPTDLPAGTVTLNEWQHFAFTFSNGTGSFYKNGNLLAKKSGMTNSGNWSSFNVGTNDSGTIDGYTDEVRVSDIARTPQEIARSAGLGYVPKAPYGIYTSPVLDLETELTSLKTINWDEFGVATGDGETVYDSTGLVAKWDFNDGTSGSNVTTLSKTAGSCTSCNGTLTGFSTTSTTGHDNSVVEGWTIIDGKWPKSSPEALMFDGVDDYVNFSSPIINTTEFGMEFWVKPTGEKFPTNPIFQQRKDTVANDSPAIVVFIEENIVQATIRDDSTGYDILTARIENLFDWHHIAVSVSSSTIDLYVDGILRDTQANTNIGNFNTNIDYIDIGRHEYNSNGGFSFIGLIDSSRIYSRPLTAEEVLSNYQSGNIELQTRSGTDNTPDDGSWEDWKPLSGSETSVDSLENEFQYTTSETNLISYWPMDETSGATVTDEKASNNGIITGSTAVFADGKWGKARSFDGSSSALSIANESNFDFEYTNNFSIEAWIKSDRAFGSIFGKMQGSYASYRGYDFHVYGNFIRLQIINTYPSSIIWVTGSTNVNDGRWHHVVATYQGVAPPSANNVKLYVDGHLESMTISNNTLSGTILNDLAPYIGSRSDTSFGYEGVIDEVRVYNSVLSSSYIHEQWRKGSGESSTVHANTDTTLVQDSSRSHKLEIGQTQVDDAVVGLWHLDETNGDLAGDDVFDESGNGNDGEFNGTNVASSVVQGISGKAREFNGSDDYITTSLNTDQSGTKSYTIEGWVYPQSNSAGYKHIITTGNGGNDWSILRDGGTWSIQNGCTALTMSGVDLDLNVWQYVVATFEPGVGVEFYKNGKKVYTNASICTEASSGNLTLGCHLTSSGYEFTGIIDEVRVLERILSETEIYNNYKKARGEFYTVPITSQDLTSNSKLPLWIAADRPGTYLEFDWGESQFENALPDNNTVGYWKMEEEYNDVTTAGWIKDSSGANNHAQLGGGTSTYIPSYTSGKVGMGRHFDGTDDYIEIVDSDSLTPSDALTISLWVYPKSLPVDNTMANREGLVDKYDQSGGDRAYLLCTYKDYISMTVSQTTTPLTGTTTNSTQPLQIDKWNHITITFQQDQQEVYLNGKLDNRLSSTSIADSIPNNTRPLIIGRMTDSGKYFHGIIDEVRIDKVVRTAAEIRAMYEKGLRTHYVNIDFGAKLDSTGLITSSTDYDFVVDATLYGSTTKTGALYPGDKIVIKENIGGTEYVSQGTVTTTNYDSTDGRTLVASWTHSPSFPSGGYSQHADVFKWQREYVDVRGTIDSQVDAVDMLSLKVLDGAEGRNVWIDDIKKTSSYLTDPTATDNVTSTGPRRYYQYRTIFTTYDNMVTPWLSEVTLETEPSTDALMRHGKFFSGGEEQPYWWAR